MEFGLCEPLQGWSRHSGHFWSRREYLGEPEICFESELFFWKLRGMFSQLKKEATWQKSTSVPILVMQCSISDIVSTRRSWLHLDVMELFIVYCWYVVRLCPRGYALWWFFLTRTVVGCFAALEVPTLSKVVFVCQNRRNYWPKIVTAKK